MYFSLAINSSIDATLGATFEALPEFPDVDWEGKLNDTEDSIKDSKVAMIEALFDAKRHVIRTLGKYTVSKNSFQATLYTEKIKLPKFPALW